METPSFPGTETVEREPVAKAAKAYIEAEKALGLAKKAEKGAKATLLFVMKREGVSCHTAGRKTFTISGKESITITTAKAAGE